MFSRRNFLLIFLAILFIVFLPNIKAVAAPSTQRLGGNDRYETAVKVSQNMWSSSQYVVLVSGKDFPDALSSATLAKKYNAPILLIEGTNIGTIIKNEILRIGVKNAIIVGGTGVISTKVDSQLQSMGIKSTRVQGKDRYETSLAVAKLIGTDNGIVLASGENFPDAVSVAPIAAAKQMPILLTPKDKLPDETYQVINNSKVSKLYIVGGTGAISNSAISKLANYKRLSGQDRYETNSAIINEFISNINFSTVYVANGEGFADALSGSAAAAKTSSPVILVHNSNSSQQSIVRNNIKSVHNIDVLGGEAVLPLRIVQNLINDSVIIAVDAGHGGYDSGAVGPNGTYEKNVTLQIALKLGKILEENNMNVVYTRTSDNVSWPSEVGKDLQTRCDISDNAGADYFVAIHANSAENPAARGIETYYCNGSEKGAKLAGTIQQELISLTGLLDRGIKTANYYVLKNTVAPSVLVEVGFISNPTEENLLSTDSFQNKLAQAIANGIIKTVRQ
ncbi:cell wall-binding repeat-containing protein [Clostridium thailandense]|uniref:cell wall-binding repeat-containing protein n=1 Tax=Clostridium thailandense TaxID=2794346 RepID=UPI0039891D67